MPRLFAGHSRTLSGQQSIEGETPDLRAGMETFSTFNDVQAPPYEQQGPRPRNHPRSQLKLPSPSEDAQREMIPVLSLLTAHSARVYEEGYFMLLNDINHDGKPVQNRQWVEVFAMLTGPTLACWDAQALDQGIDCKPTYMNITDANFKSVASLPTGKTALERIIVMSTTMKNRYLLQFSNDKQFNQWTAALRLSSFERTALQEAYTGALLSSRGSKLNGAKALLGGTKVVREDWCQVRFGGGLPWSRCWYVLTPVNLVKNKKQKKLGHGDISFYESPKHVKKEPLATITVAYSAYAVFPERAVLVDMSNLIKCHGMVKFNKEAEARESQIFLMPEQHPGIKGSETLIRFIIPFLDVFELYGRPKRLNADKRDIRSLLFAMPTLPKAYYLDVVDVGMLTALPESQAWAPQDWMQKIKEMLARKLQSGYTGLGNIHELARSHKDTSTTSGSTKSEKEVFVAKREAPKAPGASTSAGTDASHNLDLPNMNNLQVEGRNARAISQPRAMDTFVPPRSPMVVNHERSMSEGEDRNDLLSAPYTPPVHSNGSNGSGGFRVEMRNSPARSSPLRPQVQVDTKVPSNLPSQELFTPGSESSSAYTPHEQGAPGPVETKPGHYSYAEYSEYMRTYLANGIGETPQKPSGPRPQPGTSAGASAGAQSTFTQGGPKRGPQPAGYQGQPLGQPQGQLQGQAQRPPQGQIQSQPQGQTQRPPQGQPQHSLGQSPYGQAARNPYSAQPTYSNGQLAQNSQGSMRQAQPQAHPQAQPQAQPQTRNPSGQGYSQGHPQGHPQGYQGHQGQPVQNRPPQGYPGQPLAQAQGQPQGQPYGQGYGQPQSNPYGQRPPQTQGRPVHKDVRTAPPMIRPVGQPMAQPLAQAAPQAQRRTDPYAIAQVASQPQRNRVQGGRPMP